MTWTIRERKPFTAHCPECGRVFDLTDKTEADEWVYGHDCEAP